MTKKQSDKYTTKLDIICRKKIRTGETEITEEDIIYLKKTNPNLDVKIWRDYKKLQKELANYIDIKKDIDKIKNARELKNGNSLDLNNHQRKNKIDVSKKQTNSMDRYN